MRISPFFAQTTRSNTAMGQAFQRTNCAKPRKVTSKNETDVFMRLAEASMKDVKIESELKSMGLI